MLVQFEQLESEKTSTDMKLNNQRT